jgi:hypothetical protein
MKSNSIDIVHIFKKYKLYLDNFLSSLAEVVVKYTPSATCSQVVSRVPLITEVLQKEVIFYTLSL